MNLVMSAENVKKAMQQLPDGSRTIFSLYLLEGYSHSRIYLSTNRGFVSLNSAFALSHFTGLAVVVIILS